MNCRRLLLVLSLFLVAMSGSQALAIDWVVAQITDNNYEDGGDVQVSGNNDS